MPSSLRSAFGTTKRPTESMAILIPTDYQDPDVLVGGCAASAREYSSAHGVNLTVITSPSAIT
jgi:hypothetical protein